MGDGSRQAFEAMRQAVLERHSMATLVGDEEGIEAANHEFDVIGEILTELEWYEKGFPPYRRGELGTLDDLDNAKYVFKWKGNGYVFFRVRPRPEPEEGWHRWGYLCRFVCGTNWKRPHFTCLRGCWGKRIWYGKMPPVFRFKSLGVMCIPGRARWKKILSKYVFSVLEWLTS